MRTFAKPHNLCNIYLFCFSLFCVPYTYFCPSAAICSVCSKDFLHAYFLHAQSPCESDRTKFSCQNHFSFIIILWFITLVLLFIFLGSFFFFFLFFHSLLLFACFSHCFALHRSIQHNFNKLDCVHLNNALPTAANKTSKNRMLALFSDRFLTTCVRFSVFTQVIRNSVVAISGLIRDFQVVVVSTESEISFFFKKKKIVYKLVGLCIFHFWLNC